MEEQRCHVDMGRFAWARVDEETLRRVAEEQGHLPLVHEGTERFELPVIELEGDRYPIVEAGPGYFDLGPRLRINDEDGSYRFRQADGTLYAKRVELGGLLTVYPWKEIGDEVVIRIGQDLYRIPRVSPFEDDDRIPIERHPKTVRAMVERLGLPEAVIREELEALRREGLASKIKF